MEIKKSHKADLEHHRPWMFLAGLVITLTLFVVAMEWHYVVDAVNALSEDEIEMDLDIKSKDERDFIAAAPKMEKRKDEPAEQLNKVDETTEPVPEELDVQVEEDDKDAEDIDEEPPVNLNEDDPEIKRMVEELPQFPGGMVEFVKWLTAELKYPPVALQKKIQGKVLVSFIVNKDGSITSLKLEKGVNTYLDNEALRVLRKMPDWTPGKDKGKVCRTMVAVPVVFEI